MTADAPELTPADAAARLREDDTWQVLDVRTPEERPDGVIEGDVLIPLAELGARAGELDSGRPTLVYCRSGVRSEMAVAALRGAGFDAHNLAGGMLAWLEAGLPAERGG
jgi:rhodanese-related sulfurtransferase